MASNGELDILASCRRLPDWPSDLLSSSDGIDGETFPHELWIDGDDDVFAGPNHPADPLNDDDWQKISEAAHAVADSIQRDPTAFFTEFSSFAETHDSREPTLPKRGRALSLGLFLPDADTTLRNPNSGVAPLTPEAPAARGPMPSKLPVSAVLSAQGDRRRSFALPDADKTLRRASGLYVDLKNRYLAKPRRSWSNSVSRFSPSGESPVAADVGFDAAFRVEASRSPSQGPVVKDEAPAVASGRAGGMVDASLRSSVRSQSVDLSVTQLAGPSKAQSSNKANHSRFARSPSKFTFEAFEGRNGAVEANPTCKDRNLPKRKSTSNNGVQAATRHTPARGVTTRGRQAAAAAAAAVPSSTKQRRLPSLGDAASAKSPVLRKAKNAIRAPSPSLSRHKAQLPVIDAKVLRKPTSKAAAPDRKRHVAAKEVEGKLKKGVLPTFTRQATFSRDQEKSRDTNES